MLGLFFILILQFFGVGVVGALLYLAFRFVRAHEGRARIGGVDETLTKRVAELEEAVGRIDSEVLRLDEGQRFMTRLLTERRETPAVPAKDVS